MLSNTDLDFDFVVFDFDGVLVDSTSLKTEVFKKTLEGYAPEFIEAFITFHKRHGGVSRWEKLNHFLNNIMKIPEENIKETLNLLAEKFSSILALSFDSIHLTPGALEVLKTLQSNGTKCFIVSGAAESEVIALAQKHVINNYFDFILGSPKNKCENLYFLKDQGLLEGKGVFVGDALTDYKSALEFDMPFIFMSAYTEWKDWNNEQDKFFMHIHDLKELANKIKSRNKGIK